ncbi:metallo-beta-lactamase superfamily protein [Filimonas lacunae]|nr:metallo-beta-lactamase superfamily protein [Filimonas lacunae]
MAELANEKQAVKVSVTPFVVLSEGEVILLDTGLGSMVDGQPCIYNALHEAGIQPEQVTRILLSHLHKDHTNGIPLFPNATIYVNSKEYAFARTQEGNPSYNQSLLMQLPQQYKVHWMEETEGFINGEITYQVVGGHTPFHQVFWIRNNEGTTFYGGDNLPQAYYLKYHAAWKNDYDGKTAMELRLQWEKEARDENWSVLLYHDVNRDRIKL